MRLSPWQEPGFLTGDLFPANEGSFMGGMDPESLAKPLRTVFAGLGQGLLQFGEVFKSIAEQRLPEFGLAHGLRVEFVAYVAVCLARLSDEFRVEVQAVPLPCSWGSLRSPPDRVGLEALAELGDAV